AAWSSNFQVHLRRRGEFLERKNPLNGPLAALPVAILERLLDPLRELSLRRPAVLDEPDDRVQGRLRVGAYRPEPVLGITPVTLRVDVITVELVHVELVVDDGPVD